MVVRKSRAIFEVAPTQNGWKVLRRGEADGDTFPTKADAIKRAATLAEAAKPSQVLIRKRNGQIEEERTYGEDPSRFPG